ncbi:intermembrane phospholipid transport protein YdbH family protein [Paraurantiacibacter namhicola]|uniref:Dicarboxylate transport n=1 Tax=Paraurantiacibacter namhicola TaxID=645517 RepID=A0A1C7D8U5_9SPHN|nr:YdbH domain-containing protein [Paraurantiacibacter namhicola]ANU07741.1 Dicarboxylate transport [Paraurantiacibacter namhicola]
MAQSAQNTSETGREPEPKAGKRRLVWRWFLMPVLLIVGLAVAAAWLQRQELARSAIEDYFEGHGVEARYDITRISPRKQVIENVVLGDPASPDLTVKRIIVSIIPKLGLPTVRRVKLEGARLYGTFRDGELSFGALDPILLAGDGGEPELPDLDMTIRDGRVLMQTDFGDFGVKLSGAGNLSGGFEGVLAVASRDAAFGGCTLDGATLYGDFAIEAQRPLFQGPLRIADARCADAGVELADVAVTLDALVDAGLKGVDATYELAAGRGAIGDARMASLRGEGRVSYRDAEFNARYDLVGSDVRTSQANLAALSLDGTIRALDGFSSLRAEAGFEGTGLQPGTGLTGSLASAAAAAEGTLASDLLRKFGAAVEAELPGSALSGKVTLRRTGSVTSVIVPRADVSGRTGRLLQLSDLQYAAGGNGPMRLSGRFVTGGRDLPRIDGRIERRGSGGFDARLSMARYTAGNSSLALPSLSINSIPGGFRFSGDALASGDIPGGAAQGLQLPLAGTWTNGQLAMWQGCTDVRFDRLALADLSLDGRALTLCPARGQPILRYGPGGLRLAAGAPSLDLSGRLGSTPVRVASGPVGMAWPGTLSARNLDVALGPAGNATRFQLAGLTAQLGGPLAGTFEGTDILLDAVPLDMRDASGAWRYSGGRLEITDAELRVEDRAEPDRFNPLFARGAALTLFDNLVTANADLRHPLGDRLVARTAIRHDLSTSIGSADLDVPGITFVSGTRAVSVPQIDQVASGGFQPTDLTPLALGVVALVDGTVTGQGRIDWDDAGVRSTGQFTTDALDLAAAFGPVEKARGTIVFTDLLGLTTAPDQLIEVGTINPGIEVYDGEIRFQMTDGERLAVTSARWPFLGGFLSMRPVTLNLGVEEFRTYQLDVEGMEASMFVARMELNNFSATGTFDGTIPLVFDPQGNGRIEGGMLVSRPPGGNVSYQGDLLYEDMPMMAEFAFQALRSLDFKRMRIALDGALAGELVTRVRFDGVSQGEGAENNLITRQFAKLPLRFDVNIRAPFQQLLSSVRSLYDPSAIRDPRDLGLVDADGRVIRASISGQEAPPEPDPMDIPDEAVIQRPESEDVE